MPGITVVQVRDYRLHQIEVNDRGKAGFSVMIHPPANRGVSREVTRDATTVTLADTLNRAWFIKFSDKKILERPNWF